MQPTAVTVLGVAALVTVMVCAVESVVVVPLPFFTMESAPADTPVRSCVVPLAVKFTTAAPVTAYSPPFTRLLSVPLSGPVAAKVALG